MTPILKKKRRRKRMRGRKNILSLSKRKLRTRTVSVSFKRMEKKHRQKIKTSLRITSHLLGIKMRCKTSN